MHLLALAQLSEKGLPRLLKCFCFLKAGRTETLSPPARFQVQIAQQIQQLALQQQQQQARNESQLANMRSATWRRFARDCHVADNFDRRCISGYCSRQSRRLLVSQSRLRFTPFQVLSQQQEQKAGQGGTILRSGPAVSPCLPLFWSSVPGGFASTGAACFGCCRRSRALLEPDGLALRSKTDGMCLGPTR